MRIIIPLILLAVLAGCNTITGAESGLRVANLSAGGVVSAVTGNAGGVAVHQWGKDAAYADVLIVQRTDNGMVVVRSGAFKDAEVERLLVPSGEE